MFLEVAGVWLLVPEFGVFGECLLKLGPLRDSLDLECEIKENIY